jgi:hypothetical protein
MGKGNYDGSRSSDAVWDMLLDRCMPFGSNRCPVCGAALRSKAVFAAPRPGLGPGSALPVIEFNNVCDRVCDYPYPSVYEVPKFRHRSQHYCDHDEEYCRQHRGDPRMCNYPDSWRGIKLPGRSTTEKE